ncbi:unnamed protein product [Cuscuta epithymum]|uniref:Uncharacterized protein n=1 Tax=Cuscuta epithymum TaxID=186058 RepID=A0AAV0F220_9ASTE|nr:unnamed protein product [Cuscuta epithymum]CAH9129439.1 unnamed protein product [Cuscuta epithymum]
MNQLKKRTRSTGALLTPATKMPRQTDTPLPSFPQTSKANTISTNKFIAPLSLNRNKQVNRCMAPLPHFPQTPKASHVSQRTVTRSAAATVKNTHRETISTNPPSSRAQWDPFSKIPNKPLSQPTSVVHHQHNCDRNESADTTAPISEATTCLSKVRAQCSPHNDNPKYPHSQSMSAVRRHQSREKSISSGPLGVNGLHEMEENHTCNGPKMIRILEGLVNKLRHLTLCELRNGKFKFLSIE